jgi:hypothetical protein
MSMETRAKVSENHAKTLTLEISSVCFATQNQDLLLSLFKVF